MTSRRLLPVLLGAAAVALVVIGVVLVVTGGDTDTPAPDGRTGGTATTDATPDGTADGSAPAVTLPLQDTSQAAVEELTGLVLPAGTADFLTAQLEDGTQLDVTFTIPAAAADAFISASGLPTPVEGDRVVIHSSPLWKLNPEGTIRGALDSSGQVTRAVELVPEGTDRLRARVVITPAGAGDRSAPAGGASSSG